MRASIGHILSRGLALLYPPKCCGCGRSGSFLCAQCEGSAITLDRPYCRRCGRPGAAETGCAQCASAPLAVDGIGAPYLLDGAVRAAIHDLKYRNLRAVAPRLGALLARWVSTSPPPGRVLVPVPLHSRRLRHRGYNQSALLAREVARYTGLSIVEDDLVRIRDSVPQVSLSSRQERAPQRRGNLPLRGQGAGREGDPGGRRGDHGQYHVRLRRGPQVGGRPVRVGDRPGPPGTRLHLGAGA